MQNEFNEKVKKYQLLFGLTNWNIIIDWDTPLPEAGAKTIADPRYHKAVMTLSDTIKQDQTTWDAIIIHEYIHIVMSLYDFFCDNMGQEGSDNLFFIARESSVSQLTTIMMRMRKI